MEMLEVHFAPCVRWKRSIDHCNLPRKYGG